MRLERRQGQITKGLVHYIKEFELYLTEIVRVF